MLPVTLPRVKKENLMHINWLDIGSIKYCFLILKESKLLGKMNSKFWYCWYAIKDKLNSFSWIFNFAYCFIISLFRTGNQCSQGIGYYTQLVWQDTTHVGCGWTQFRYRGFPNYFENFLVCNYGPSANIWQQPVYDIANSTCNCQCLECDKGTGLCPPRCK